jgi:RNA polymerase sigma-70 factor (ECF subfamily)
MNSRRRAGLLDREMAADEDAYRRFVEPHRAELHAHCYRMLGSVHDAEDALQDALLRAWRGLPGFAGRSSPRFWLYRIATNACLDVVARRPKRLLPIDYGPSAERPYDTEPLEESVWVEPYHVEVEDGLAAPDARYERRESVELAFVAALQLLPPRQRAVLILREVLGFSAREVAELLETTEVSVNSALQRARKAVDERLPEQSQQATLRSLGDARLRSLVERYMDAMERADLDAVLALLVEDATWSMPPETIWFRGHEAIARFLSEWPFTNRWRHVPVRASAGPAVGCYAWNDESGSFVAEALDVLTLRGGRIAAITAFRNVEIFPRFGLPHELTDYSTDLRRSLFVTTGKES